MSEINDTNEDRNRWYGVRVGDIVSYSFLKDFAPIVGVVVELHPHDNNCVFIQDDSDRKPFKVTPEHCDIIERAEDRTGAPAP